jgi:hypothetical protein
VFAVVEHQQHVIHAHRVNEEIEECGAGALLDLGRLGHLLRQEIRIAERRKIDPRHPPE